MKYKVHVTGATITNVKLHDKKTINLGLWCDPQSQKKYLTKFNIKKSRNINLTKLTYAYIKLLSEELNYYHKTNLSFNFWKNLLFPWVYSFITLLHDRYLTIKQIKNKRNYSFIFQEDVQNHIIQKNFFEYKMLSQHDYFNSYIFFDLLKLFDVKSFIFKKIKKRNIFKTKIKSKKRFKNFLYKLTNLVGSKDVIFYDAGISLKKNFHLCKKFFVYNNQSEISLKNKKDLKFRKKTLNYNKDICKNLNYFLNKILLKYLPKCYLEDFKDYYYSDLDHELSKNPRLIITNVSHIADDKFKIWFAKNKEKNPNLKMIINQHGGSHHTSNEPLYKSNENICDATLNWGNFSITKVKKIVTGINLKKNNYIPKKKILYVANSISKYYCDHTSNKQGPSNFEHIEYEKKFFSNLDDNIISSMDIKPYVHEFGWNFIQQIKKIKNRINVLDKNFNIENNLSDYELVISSYPNTTFFISICLQIPTILINSTMYQYNGYAKKFFDSFLKNNIAFNNPEKASKFVNNNFNNFSKIFNSRKIKKSINNFKKNFINDNQNYNLDLEKSLIDYLNKNIKK